MRQGTALSVHVHEGQEAVEPQFFIAIEDNQSFWQTVVSRLSHRLPE